MCEPTTIMLGVSLAMAAASAASQVQQGRAAAKGHKQNAFAMDTKRIETRTATSQASRDRWLEFEDAQSTNNMAIAMTGLAPDSFDAGMAENRRRAGQDVRRIRDQGEVEDAELRYAAANERAEAKAAKRRGLTQGLFTMGSAVVSAGMNMPGGSGVAKSVGSASKSLFRP